MSTKIKCPHCNHEFPLQDAINDEFKEHIEREKQLLRNQMVSFKQTKEEELKNQEEKFRKSFALQEEKLKLQFENAFKQQQLQMEENMRKSIASEYENQLKVLKKTTEENEKKLKESRDKELAYLQLEQKLKIKEEELELTLQRRFLEEREKLKEQVMKEESERMGLKEQEYMLKMRELEKQLESQKKLAEEMRRKAEQGSMQLQGEVQEILLEEILKSAFPYDSIDEVGKGIRGADCIQTVRTRFGTEAGKIVFESKRTKEFSNEWPEKLKQDMRHLGGDIAVLVTKTLPKDIERFGEKDGVYVCSFGDIKSVVLLLRNAILKIHETKLSGENKGDKMSMLYDYLTGNEFSEQWKAIREGFMAMKLSIQKERDAMERLWKAREKQLEKVLLSAAHIRGSMDGISGASISLGLLDEADNDEWDKM